MNEKSPLHSLPLYKKVKSILVDRIAKGIWAPGALIPTEFQLADELHVSQGTVRKALEEMRVDRLLNRRQGLGTFVTSIDDDRILFAFFRMVSDEGTRQLPDTVVRSVKSRKATAGESQKLGLGSNAGVWAVERIRTLDNAKVIKEQIVLPAKLFPGLGDIAEFPSNIYRLFADSYSLTVRRVVEKIKAVAASRGDAKVFGCPLGHPLLEVERVGYGLDGLALEFRLSRWVTDDHYYLCELQ
jgi:GntR family transcriptional regulator